MVGLSQFYNLKIIRNINSMKLKLLILSLSFLLISCGGPPSEDSKTTIMDVVKYLEQVDWKDFFEMRLKMSEMSEEEYLNYMSEIGIELPNPDEKVCGKFESYQPKIASLVGAIEGGRIRLSMDCSGEVYKYSDKSAAILNARSGLLEKSKCFAKGYFVFCGFSPGIMHDF